MNTQQAYAQQEAELIKSKGGIQLVPASDEREYERGASASRYQNTTLKFKSEAYINGYNDALAREHEESACAEHFCELREVK